MTTIIVTFRNFAKAPENSQSHDIKSKPVKSPSNTIIHLCVCVYIYIEVYIYI
jgi:hypothetical protein